MGNASSSIPGVAPGSFTPPKSFPFFFNRQEEHEEPEEFVIVPPIIPMDRQEINRMAFSSYEWAHRPRELSVLLSQYLRPGASASLNFVPPSDNRLLTTANVRLPHAFRHGWASFLSEGPGAMTADDTWADLAVRTHLSKADPHSFLSFVVGSTTGFLSPGLHFATVPSSAGPGFFGHMPLDMTSPEDGLAATRVGARYASQNVSAGLSLQAINPSVVDKAWLLVRHRPEGTEATHVTFGWQLEPQHTIGDVCSGRVPVRNAVRAEDTSSFFQYQSGGKDSYFTLTVEAVRVQALRFSVFQHLARVRRVYNLFEDDDVIGITNYLDFGLSVDTPVGAAKAAGAAPTFEGAAAWQVNSNVLVKAAVSTQRVCSAMVIKSWWEPSFSLSIMGGWDLQEHGPCAGITLNVDNDAQLRYERGLHTRQTGSLVRQKHAATKAEGLVSHGARIVVPGESQASDDELLVPPPVTHRSSDML